MSRWSAYGIVALLWALVGCASLCGGDDGPSLALYSEDDDELVWHVYRQLQDAVPCSRDVVLVVHDLGRPRLLGYIEGSDVSDVLLVHVDSKIPPAVQAEVLIHEWAHGLVWDVSPSILEPHGPLWGIAYARAYKATR